MWCGGCAMPLNPNSRHITKKYQGKEYHHNCLKCSQCSNLIEGEVYDENNNLFCGKCYKTKNNKRFQEINTENNENQKKTVRFAEKLHETLNRNEIEDYYKEQANINGEMSYCAACLLPFHGSCRITQTHDKEYHYECFCCEICHLPINGIYTPTNNGRAFQCGNCIQKTYPVNVKLCHECGQPLDLGVQGRVQFNNKHYHSECFVCVLCNRKLNTSQTFLIHNDQPWCAQCEEDVKKCFNCSKPILTQGIKYENNEYHVECFTCRKCNKLLENEKLLTAHNSLPYCVQCHDELFAKKCFKCKRPIPHSTKYMTFEERPYHEQCFLCDKCHRPIGSNNKFFKDQRGFICSNCGGK
ncbi:unnamed protein product [Didymodactylos carnosus]|uniref:LIM zinc-binding domain-containing protein n=1 Tax=Didymodactylos carnosus TaxID=1234261 RepID=A0A8S2J027_9BILA|nr:unnamed protein product [Didymodactylos carnosus]CAF3788049.1 unnamed protein product [Didymodactylos carnosus]